MYFGGVVRCLGVLLMLKYLFPLSACMETLISAELGEQPALRLSVSGLGFFVLKV